VLAGLAPLIARQVAIVAATGPKQEHRGLARALAPRFLEVLVDTPLEQCARRDPKGLYAAAHRGELTTLPGEGAAYERPGSQS
jgi:bifunctional enzyme CysN/CysC